MKSGNINQFKHLSQFDSIKDFNSSIEQWMVDYKSEFTKSEMIAFNRLKRYAAKVYGVSNVSINKLSAVSKELDQGGISRSTFKRMLKKAKQFGIITVYETERNNGSKSTNVYVFNRYTQSEPCPKEEIVEESPVQQQFIDEQLNHPKTHQISKTNNIITKRSILNVPDQFAEYLSAYFTGKEIVEMWKCIKHATKYLNHYDLTAKVILGVNAMRNMRQQLKEGYRVKKSMFSLYWGIVNKMLDREYNELIVSC